MVLDLEEEKCSKSVDFNLEEILISEENNVKSETISPWFAYKEGRKLKIGLL
jgi:hypothetical protein